MPPPGNAMKSNLIQSAQRSTRSATAALLASLAAPGLGQMYCGRLSRGTIFAASMVLSALLVPMGLIFRDGEPSLHRALLPAAAYIIILLACHVDAVLSARGKTDRALKRYNSAWGYALFALPVLSLHAGALFFSLSFYSLIAVPGDSMAPTFQSGEIALLGFPPGAGWKPGDAVAFRDRGATAFGRIIAVADDSVERAKGRIAVNGVPLSLGIYTDRELARFGTADTESVFYEVSGNRRYPVIQPPEKNDRDWKDIPATTVPKGSVMIAFDNRASLREPVTSEFSSITGRLEGVIWPAAWRRIFLLPHSRL